MAYLSNPWFHSTCLKGCFLLMLLHQSSAWESVWNVEVDQSVGHDYNIFPNYMYKNSFVWVQINCRFQEGQTSYKILVHWIMQEIECMEEMYLSKTRTQEGVFIAISQKLNEQLTNQTLVNTTSLLQGQAEDTVRASFQASKPMVYECRKESPTLMLNDETPSPYYTAVIPKSAIKQGITADTPIQLESHQRDGVSPYNHDMNHRVVDAWKDGMYHFLLSVSPMDNTTFEAGVYVQMRGAYGYLPAIMWPRLPVSGVMSFLYLFAGTGWIIVWAKAHQHTHRIHLVIGTVAVAGALWNTLMFVELSTTNSNGTGVMGLLWLSRLLSALQSSLTQLLLMIVATGFGISRPKLTPSLIYVPSVLFFLSFTTNFGVMVIQDEHLRLKYTYPLLARMCYILYGVVATAIAIWIMVFSILTFLHLHRRRHSDKHKFIAFLIFMATCILTFLGLVFLLLLSFGLFTSCRKDWQVEWLFSAWGQIEVILLLIVLMWLWRPTDEQQSYAFQPLSTLDDDADDKAMLTGSEEEEEEDVLMDRSKNGALKSEAIKLMPMDTI